MAFRVDSVGLRQWSVGERQMLHPHSYFALSEPYTRHFPAFAGTTNPGNFIGAYEDKPQAVGTFVEYENASMRQTWRQSSPHSLYGTITVFPHHADTIKVWGLSRLHVELPGITELYPRVAPGDLAQNLGTFFPSHGIRIGGRAWLKSPSGEFHVALRGECATKRHLLYWERYSESRYALHVIFFWPLGTEAVEVEIELSSQPIQLPASQASSTQSQGRPVIQCCRAMAEYISESNPHGYVNARLDNEQEALAYITPLARRAARIRALGIIGWPWGYTDLFGLHRTGGHSYPYNSFAVPRTLLDCLQEMKSEWCNAGAGSFGGLYRPMYHMTNGVRNVRWADKTGLASVVADFEVFEPELLYLDDCGVDSFTEKPLDYPHSRDFVDLLYLMRYEFGPLPTWYVEHPSSATLPYAGGYVVLEKHPDGLLRPNIGEMHWQSLRQAFPGASWLVAAGSQLWGPPWDVQRNVIEWCYEQGGNVSPLIQDWLLTEELTEWLEQRT